MNNVIKKALISLLFFIGLAAAITSEHQLLAFILLGIWYALAFPLEDY